MNATEGMTVDEALAHANCSAALSASPAHVADALQVLAAHVAELEAEREPSGTEWGVRWDDGTVHAPARNSEQINRRLAAQTDRTLMRRDVYAPGPWRVAE